MAKFGENLGYLAKFLTKFALFDEQKMAFLVASSFAALSSPHHSCCTSSTH